MLQKKPSSPFTLAVTAISTALVCTATMIFSVYVPATKGFFNIGESMVFLSALLFGSHVGAFAGGVGSMLADILLGYSYYAPATLVIKACEGYIVGFLKSNNPRLVSKTKWKILTFFLGILAGSVLAAVGVTYYSGLIEVTLGTTVYAFLAPTELWIILGAFVASFIAIVGLKAEPEFGWTVFSVISGGLIMVLGYFTYQLFIIGPLFNIQVVAVAELPINIGQMVIGAVVALPSAKVIWKAFPNLKHT
ncbi:MAG: ECF transporter S component [Candidatus Bathyarchaeia archaeon]